MKTIYNYVLVVLIAAAVSFGICYWKGAAPGKSGFMKNTEVYNNFDLKKELETKLINVKNQRRAILDSLMISLKAMSVQLEKDAKNTVLLDRFGIQRQAYLEKQKEFDEDNQRLAEEYSQQIWKQINQYVEDFGKANGYGYIYGATGDGAIMYAEDKYDITKELSAYVNERYKGNK